MSSYFLIRISDSEVTSDPFYENFLNSSAKKNEFEKAKRIYSEIIETFKKSEKPKRKSPKKAKISEDATKTETINSQMADLNNEINIA